MDSTKVLVVNHIDDLPELDARVTFSPYAIQFVSAIDMKRRGRDLKFVTVHMIEKQDAYVCISPMELMILERAVGTYMDED